MKSPKVAVTSLLTGSKQPASEAEVSKHCAAIERAGGHPLALHMDVSPSQVIDELEIQGIIFSGGGDICAARYNGNETLATDRVNIQRDAFEFELLQRAFIRKLPILGICRGMQIANVALGGTLIEDLRLHLGTEYRIDHQQIRDAERKSNEYSHAVTTIPGTLLRAIVQRDRFPVNSLHHQAIRELASPLRVCGVADDGIIEAVEFAEEGRGFFIGIQWHPEQMPADDIARSLYGQLIEACSTYEFGGFQDVPGPGSALSS